MKKINLLLLVTFVVNIVQAQPFTKKYIMSFLTCDANCTGFQDHIVNLAESDDGSTWTLVPNFISYSGSVPDVITRGTKLYIYTPGKVKRYDNSLSVWDASPVMTSIQDSIGGNVNFVDPSAYVDDQGRLVLFFLNSTGIPMGQDPAGCQPYPCDKVFDSAIEVTGSDGTQFTMQSGHRAVLNLQANSASDPDIFFDGTNYIMYISKGNSIYACASTTLHGSYSAITGLSNGLLTNMGGIPCGYYDLLSGNYFTYVHANVSGNTVIRQAISSNLNSQLNTFTTVASGPIIGEPATTKTESPGFCTNDFLSTTISEYNNAGIKVFPNPANSILTIQNLSTDKKSLLEIINFSGTIVFKTQVYEQTENIDISGLARGLYFYQIKSDKGILKKGKIIID